MKFNLEVNIDWIDEESNLDDTIKQEIINGITNKIEKNITSQVEGKVKAQIDDLTVSKIDDLVDSMFKDFTSKPVAITDGYGDVYKEYETMTHLIKSKFDNFLTQSVDDKGRTDNSRYGNKYTRIEYMIDKQLKDFADKFTKETVEKVSAEIKNHVKDGLTTKLGAELMNVLKVDKMLKIAK